MLRAVYAQADMNSSPDMTDPYDPNHLFDDKKSSFAGFGFKYTPGDFFLLGEFGEVKIDGAVSDTQSYYLATGYSVGEVTPYVRYSVNKTLDDDLRPEGSPIFWFNADYSSASIGARWDFMPKAALKADVTQRNDKNRDDVTVYTISIDTAF